MSNKAIVLDANILIRAVLGKRVREFTTRTHQGSNSSRPTWSMTTQESTYLRCWKSAVYKAQRQ